MNILFRVDASLAIGTGHVMRCLTLADALAVRGARCVFASREREGHLFGLIEQRGHRLVALPEIEDGATLPLAAGGDLPSHAAWLGLGWQEDAEQTRAAIGSVPVDWLVADHYALDARWEQALSAHAIRIMAIDDLADRRHACDVLLDQNLAAGLETRYRGKIPPRCRALLGPSYALLRPEFAALREASLGRRKAPSRERLLVFMSGSDPGNETAKAVAGIALAQRRWRHVDAVVGGGFPALAALEQELARLPSATLHVQTPHMAELMLAADLAITGGGSVTWEKCALGLPSLVAILAENQRPGAVLMHDQRAQRTLGEASALDPARYAQELDKISTGDLTGMTAHASSLCDGAGTERVITAMETASRSRSA